MEAFRKNIADLILVLAGKVCTVGVVFVGGLLVARGAGQAEYGIFSVAIGAVLLLDGVIGSALDMGAVRFSALHAGQAERTQRFEAMAMQLKLAAAMTGLLGAWLLKGPLIHWWPALSNSAFPLVPCLFATVALLLGRSAATACQIRRQFKLYAWLDVGQASARLLGFLILACLGTQAAGTYVLIYGATAVLAAAFCIAYMNQRYLLGPWPARQDIIQMLRYSGFIAGIATLGIFTGKADLLILAAAQGAGGTASYALASQLAGLAGQLALYASVVTQPRLIGIARSGRLRHIAAMNIGAAVVIGLLAACVLKTSFLSWGITTLFGTGFQPSVGLLHVLVFRPLIDFATVPILIIFCIQTCPAESFIGEAIIAIGFVCMASLAAQNLLWLPPEPAMAWIVVIACAAKFLLYGGLFLKHTTATPSEGS